MVSALRKTSGTIQDSKPVPYELVELKEFDRVTDEAASVRAIFGQPISEAVADKSILPLVIIGYDKQKIVSLLRDSRANIETCLRPIAVIGMTEHALDPLVDHLADGVLPPRPDSEQLRDMSVTLNLLHRQLRDIRMEPEDRPLSLLQFLYTRGSSLQPTVSPDDPQAYSYPLAELLMDVNANQVRELLDDMAVHQIVSQTHVDRLFTCPDCSHYRVCVKELCPECDSTHLETQESIHHFRCGHVGPESDFMISGRPVCPKCRGDVQHIGVEYNRPGRFVVCGSCHYWASEPVLTAWCAVCNTYHSPADLQPVNISSYALSQNAMAIARIGSWNPQQVGVDSRKSAQTGKTRASKSKPGAKKDRTMAKPLDAIAKVVMKIADENDNPTTVYRAALNEKSADWQDQLDEARATIQTYANESLLCIEQRQAELMIVLHDSSERRTPTCRQLEKAVRHETGIDLSVEEIDDNDDSIVANPSDRLA